MRPLLTLVLLTACARKADTDLPAPITETPQETASASDTTVPPTDTPSEVTLHGTRPPQALAAPDFLAHNHDGALRAREHLIGQPTVMWFFPATGTPG
jgi:hypothetical protein